MKSTWKKSRIVTVNTAKTRRELVIPLPGFASATGEDYGMIVLCGKKNSGKSTMLLKLLLDERAFFKRYDRIVIISPTFDTQYSKRWYRISSKGVQVYSKISTKLLEHLTAQQAVTDDSMLVITDNIGEALKHVDQTVMSTFTSNSRHSRVTIVALVHRITHLPTTYRTNVDVWWVYASCTQHELEALYKECGMIDKKDFIALFRKVTSEPFGFFACA